MKEKQMTTTACADCWRYAAIAPTALLNHGHPECKAAIQAERTAARQFWVRFNPDGCAEGSTLFGDDTPDAEAAHKRFTSRIRDRQRETKAGYRHELVNGTEWDTVARPCLLGKCEHRLATAGGAQ